MTLFELLGIIKIDNAGANAAIDQTAGKAADLASSLNSSGGVTGAAQSMGSKVASAASKVGTTVMNAAKTVGKTVAAGAAVGATAVTALTKQAVSAYADYEQLVGGVDTLFKDASDAVQEYAADAYKTAGMSANDYMETVTSFSASLIQSLKGDVKTAADVANQTIVDMSDNANKMGTDMTMIQNAYNGFAKQNFTMLDNLKLGYGGTKTEMQRLLDDATALSGIEYDLSSFADISEAIHVIQTNLGITGTTAKEASSTISGSWSSLKAAWKNTLVGVASGDQDLGGLFTNLGVSAGDFAKNLIPRIGEALKGIGSALPELGKSLAPALSEGLSYALGTIGIDVSPDAISNFTGNMVDKLKTGFENAKDGIAGIAETIGGMISDNMPTFLNIGENLKGIGQSIFGTLSTEFGQIDWAGAFSGITAIVDGITGSINNFMTADSGTALGTIRDFLGEIAMLPVNGLDAVAGAIENVGAAFKVAEGIGEGKINITAAINEMKQQLAAGETDLANGANSIRAQLEGLLDGINMGTPDFSAAISAAGAAADAIAAIIAGGISAGMAYMTDLKNSTPTATDIATGKDIPSKGGKTYDGKAEQNAAIAALQASQSGTGRGSDFVKNSGKSSGGMVTGSSLRNPEYNADGAIFSKATIFGMANGRLQVAGEAGAEAVAPIDVLQGYVANAVAAQNQGMYEMMAQMMESMREYTEAVTDGMRESMQNVTIKIGKREFGRTVKEVNA